jgi:hypothetical protein
VKTENEERHHLGDLELGTAGKAVTSWRARRENQSQNLLTEKRNEGSQQSKAVAENRERVTLLRSGWRSLGVTEGIQACRCASRRAEKQQEK